MENKEVILSNKSSEDKKGCSASADPAKMTSPKNSRPPFRPFEDVLFVKPIPTKTSISMHKPAGVSKTSLKWVENEVRN